MDDFVEIQLVALFEAGLFLGAHVVFLSDESEILLRCLDLGRESSINVLFFVETLKLRSLGADREFASKALFLGRPGWCPPRKGHFDVLKEDDCHSHIGCAGFDLAASQGG